MQNGDDAAAHVFEDLADAVGGGAVGLGIEHGIFPVHWLTDTARDLDIAVTGHTECLANDRFRIASHKGRHRRTQSGLGVNLLVRVYDDSLNLAGGGAEHLDLRAFGQSEEPLVGQHQLQLLARVEPFTQRIGLDEAEQEQHDRRHNHAAEQGALAPIAFGVTHAAASSSSSCRPAIL